MRGIKTIKIRAVKKVRRGPQEIGLELFRKRLRDLRGAEETGKKESFQSQIN